MPHRREEIKRIIEAEYRKEFPNDTVDVSDGYADNIHVVVVSRRFDDLDEQHKQDLLWSILDRTSLTDDEKGLVSLLLPVSPAQIK